MTDGRSKPIIELIRELVERRRQLQAERQRRAAMNASDTTIVSKPTGINTLAQSGKADDDPAK